MPVGLRKHTVVATIERNGLLQQLPENGQTLHYKNHLLSEMASYGSTVGSLQ